jgi:TusA-related sulfurtransferase
MTETPNVDEELDLQGEVCPYTFVKSKLALEEMEAGQVLRVIVTNPESADNVPRSLKNEGHTVLDISRLGDQRWAILVKKA